jgi:hypothetical protein
MMEKSQVNIETWKRRAKYLLRHPHVEGRFHPDDRGLWPVVQESFDHLGDGPEKIYSAEYVFSSWRPARVLAAKGYDIDPADTPALPFPFDAKELAAFMVNGMGAFVAEWYCDGDWDNGLSMEALEQSIPVDEVWLRQTVREAIDAYRVAKEAIGCPDGEHPDPDDIVWQLLKPDDAPAAPTTEQQDAPKSNGDVDQTERDAEAAYRRKRRDLLTPVIEKAQRQSGNKYDAAIVWNELVKMAQAQESPLKGVTEDGIQWADGNNEWKHLSLKNLRDRITRKQKQKTEAERATTR